MSRPSKKKKKRSLSKRYGERGTISPRGKRTQEEYDADLEIVMRMWHRNGSTSAIAAYLNSIRTYTISRSAVYDMVAKELVARKAESAENFERDCERHVEKLEALIGHCWQQIEKLEGSQSSETVQRLVTRPGEDGKELTTTFVEQIKKDHQGGTDYYGTIERSMREIARIKGMYKPLKIAAVKDELPEGLKGFPPVQISVITEKPLSELKVFKKEDIEIEPEPEDSPPLDTP